MTEPYGDPDLATLVGLTGGERITPQQAEDWLQRPTPKRAPAPTVDQAANALADQTKIRGLSVEDGAAVLELAPPRELVIAFVDAARKMLGDAENYSETRIDFPAVSMEIKAAGEVERYVFTVQRAGKLTPHEARKQAEAERDNLARELGQTKARLEGERRITAAYSEQARTHRCIPLAGGPDSSVSINTSGVPSGGDPDHG